MWDRVQNQPPKMFYKKSFLYSLKTSRKWKLKIFSVGVKREWRRMGLYTTVKKQSNICLRFCWSGLETDVKNVRKDVRNSKLSDLLPRRVSIILINMKS